VLAERERQAAAESQARVAESDRLREMAFSLRPSLRVVAGGE
jgi:hypothetical protein